MDSASEEAIAKALERWSQWRWKEMDTFQRYLGHKASRTWNGLDTRIRTRKSLRETPPVLLGQPEVGR